MGRSPYFTRHVRPIEPRAANEALGIVFDHFFRVGEVAFYEDNTRVAEPEKSARIRIQQSEHAQTPTLERSCSVYRRREDYFPSKEAVYRVRRAVRHMFCNEHSAHTPFWYDLLEVENEDDRYYTTFCVRTDGAILNVESLTLRGYATDVVLLATARPRRAG